MEAKEKHRTEQRKKLTTFDAIPLGRCESTLHCKVVFKSSERLSDSSETIGRKYFDAVLLDTKLQMANIKAWGALSDKYYSVFQEGSWYFISNFEVLASSRSEEEELGSRELLLLEDCCVTQTAEPVPVPDKEDPGERVLQPSQKSRYSQVVRSWSSQVLPLKTAVEREKGSFVNTCGLIVSIGNTKFKAVKQGGSSDLRCIYLTDDSVDEPVEVVFWKEKCAQVESLRVGEVVTISNLKVGEFLKKNLVVAQTTEISKESEGSGLVLMLKKAIAAKESKVHTKLQRVQSRDDFSDVGTGLKTLRQVQAIAERMRKQKKQMKITVNSTGFITDLPIYPNFHFAKCPRVTCFRFAKPIDSETSLCSRCGEVSGKVVHRYIGGCSLADHTQSLDVRFTRDDVGQVLFGMPVEELLQLYDGAGIMRQHVLHNKLTKRILSRLFTFKLKIIFEVFHEKFVLRINLQDPLPVKHETVTPAASSLLASIAELMPKLAASKSSTFSKETRTSSLHHAAEPKPTGNYI